MIGELAETRWQIRSVRSVGRLVPTIDGRSPAELTFLGDGRFAGSTGCNRFFGQFEVVDGGLEAGPVGVTMMMCPEDLMTQERAVLAAIETTTTIARSDGLLHFLDATGTTVLECTPIEDTT